MAPFLRDEGPPVSKETIQRARESLPAEYGVQPVNERGRDVLLVRVPKAKPDYLHDLADVAFYVTLEMVRSVKDVLLVGHEKTARLEPQLLRDHIRAQDREDVEIIADIRKRLGRDYAHLVVTSPSNHNHQALAVRIPKPSLQDFGPDDVRIIRDVVNREPRKIEACQYAYLVADGDHERVGRRVLLELIGAPATPEPAPSPAAISALTGAFDPPAPVAPAFPPAAPQPEKASVARAFPPTPVAPVAAAPMPAPAVAAPPPAAQPPAHVPRETIMHHDEYEVTGRSRASAPPAPPAEAAPAQPRASGRGGPLTAPEGADVQVHDEYEVVSKPKVPAAAAAPVEMPEAPPHVERNVHVEHEEYEVYTSKPKPRAQAPAITPPGQGGFQNAFSAATHAPPARTKEYEIMGAAKAPASAPLHVPPPQPMPQQAPQHAAFPAVRDDPRIQPAVAARAPPQIQPTPDNGAHVIPRVSVASPEIALMQRFREAGYEVVEQLRAQGTVFAFAAHKPNGRRVLVKRAAEFGADDAVTLAQLIAALGADVCVVVADAPSPGVRIATWGTRLEVVTPTEALSLSF